MCHRNKPGSFFQGFSFTIWRTVSTFHLTVLYSCHMLFMWHVLFHYGVCVNKIKMHRLTDHLYSYGDDCAVVNSCDLGFGCTSILSCPAGSWLNFKKGANRINSWNTGCLSFWCCATLVFRTIDLKSHPMELKGLILRILDFLRRSFSAIPCICRPNTHTRLQELDPTAPSRAKRTSFCPHFGE